MQIDLEELKGKESREIERFNDRLLELLPGLGDHHCDLGRPGGFAERLVKGTHLNHVIEHAAQELLALAASASEKEVLLSHEKDDSKALLKPQASKQRAI
jgi:hypothetical protein